MSPPRLGRGRLGRHPLITDGLRASTHVGDAIASRRNRHGTITQRHLLVNHAPVARSLSVYGSPPYCTVQVSKNTVSKITWSSYQSCPSKRATSVTGCTTMAGYSRSRCLLSSGATRRAHGTRSGQGRAVGSGISSRVSESVALPGPRRGRADGESGRGRSQDHRCGRH
jgi:hypothetical protein